MITFGYLESQNAASAIDFLRHDLHCRRIVAIGQSLGGAALILGKGPVSADALILESVYPYIEKAVENRLAIRLGELGRIAAPLLYEQIPLRFGISLTELKPENAVRKMFDPVLVIGGSADRHTTMADTQELFAAIPGDNKTLWIVEGAAHQDLYLFNPQAYMLQFNAFIERAW